MCYNFLFLSKFSLISKHKNCNMTSTKNTKDGNIFGDTSSDDEQEVEEIISYKE